MDALEKILVVAVAFMAVACIVPMASETSDASGEASGLLLYEVNPFTNEGVSVYNYGTSTVDLRDYRISDYPVIGEKEGYISFTESIKVEPGTFVVIADDSGETNHFVDREGVEVYRFGENGIEVSSGFALAKYKGDTAQNGFEGSIMMVGDLFGDWREEIVTVVDGELRVYTTTIPAADRRVTFLQDPLYRSYIYNRSMGYQQSPSPTHNF